MAVFKYEFFDPKGSKGRDVCEANTRDEALRILQSRGHRLIRWLNQGSASFSRLKVRNNRRILNQDQLILFTKDLAHLIKSEVPIDRTIRIIEDSSSNKSVKAMATFLYDSVQSGSSLAESMGEKPADFNDLYVSMVRVGETGGILAPVMERLAEFMERTQEIKKFIISTSIYPAILLSVGIVSVLVIMGFVVPKFADIFRDLGQDMPLSTKILLNMGVFLGQWWWLLIALTILFGLLSWRLIKTTQGKIIMDKLLIRIPYLGELLMNIQVSRFARTLGVLMQSGVPILKSLGIVKDVVGNIILKDIMVYIAEQVREGRNLSGLMKENKMFPPMLVQMVSLGEETGKMGQMLVSSAENLDVMIQNRIKMLLTFIEPVAILVMGIIIGGIVVSMLSTIFGINDISF
ncbi:MAG: type II secretion system F family protein [Deltaproteobacteria bacterium]|uniref:type II secretion system F family protein n=1 Tax=Desulfobacula sp. TaxID=2593537 RepID=UPI0019B5E2BF|nr:type II secretion system F family protein [Candidatus Desulfobacula maris]MBL6994730.1 type II secretion system F family protein [Desulfobacula sp.]